jgi:hypothetical protein
MRIGWKVFLPISLAWFLFVAGMCLIDTSLYSSFLGFPSHAKVFDLSDYSDILVDFYSELKQD